VTEVLKGELPCHTDLLTTMADLYWDDTQNYEGLFVRFIQLGCDANAKNAKDEFILHVATLAENVKCVEALLKNGAFPNSVNKYEIQTDF
jgi:ankyrin repeat protein